MTARRAHRNQLIAFLNEYLVEGLSHDSSAEYIRATGLESVRDSYPLIRIVDLLAIDEFVTKTNLK